MNFSFYILGTPEGRYSQYPDDYTASTLSGLQDGMAGARLVIYREMDLVHYAYTERLGNNNIIGFCLIFNKVRVLKPHQLIKLFRFIIEKRLIESGDIIKYNEDGDLVFRVRSMNECIKEYDKLKGYINSEFENNASKYGIEPLKSTFNGVRSTGEADNNASDGQIVALTNQHNKVIVNDDNGIEHGYIPQVISSLREQNLKSTEVIKRLHEENAALDKKKKQYRFVIFLALVVIGCAIGLFFLNDNLKMTQEELSEAHQTIYNKNEKISGLNSDIESLKQNLNDEKERRQQAEDNLDSLKSSLNQMQPFIVKSTSFNFSTGWLSFDYYGFRDETVDVQVRAFGDYAYNNSSSIAIEKGYHSNSIYLSSSLNSSKWYSFELLVGNKIVGGDRH